MRRRTRALAAVVAVVATAAVAAAVPVNAARQGDDLSFATSSIDVREGQGQVSIEVRRGATDALEESEAWFATADTDDGAVAESDYLSTEGRVRLAVGQTGATLTVFVHSDDEEETAESFVMRLTPSRHSTRVLDEIDVVIIDDDTPTVAAAPAADRSSGGAAGASNSGTRSEMAAAASASAQPVPRTVVRPRSARAGTTTRRPTTARVTPFELQPSAGGAYGSVPAPAHTTPVAAAGLLAALLLARVCAELWFRWRIDET